jgi:hypothetical protein
MQQRRVTPGWRTGLSQPPGSGKYQIHFSTRQRGVLTPTIAGQDLRSGLHFFERRCEGAAVFEWKHTSSDLGKLMERFAVKPDYQPAA